MPTQAGTHAAVYFNTDEDRRAHGCGVNRCTGGYRYRLVDVVLVQVIIAAVGVKKEEKNLAVMKSGGC